MYRTEAYLTLGIAAWNGVYSHDREAACRYYRRLIDLASAATEADLSGNVMSPDDETGKFVEEPVRKYVSAAAMAAEANLAQLERRPVRSLNLATQETPKHTVTPLEKVHDEISDVFVPISLDPSVPQLLTHEEFEKLMIPGGAACSFCGKQRTAGVMLKLCSCCRRAHYCGGACQKAAWKEGGHRLVCRQPGQYYPGDLVIIRDLSSRSDMNGMVTILRKPLQSSPKRWEVGCTDCESLRASALCLAVVHAGDVAATYLFRLHAPHRIRPAAGRSLRAYLYDSRPTPARFGPAAPLTVCYSVKEANLRLLRSAPRPHK